MENTNKNSKQNNILRLFGEGSIEKIKKTPEKTPLKKKTKKIQKIQNYTPHVWTLVTWCPMGSIVLDFLDFLDCFVFLFSHVFYFLYGALSKESQNIVFFGLCFLYFPCVFLDFSKFTDLHIEKTCVLPRFGSYVVQNIL